MKSFSFSRGFATICGSSGDPVLRPDFLDLSTRWRKLRQRWVFKHRPGLNHCESRSNQAPFQAECRPSSTLLKGDVELRVMHQPLSVTVGRSSRCSAQNTHVSPRCQGSSTNLPPRSHCMCDFASSSIRSRSSLFRLRIVSEQFCSSTLSARQQ